MQGALSSGRPAPWLSSWTTCAVAIHQNCCDYGAIAQLRRPEVMNPLVSPVSGFVMVGSRHLPSRCSTVWPRSSAVSRHAFALLSAGHGRPAACWAICCKRAPPVSLFLCAIIFTAAFAGLGPALAAALLSVLAFGYFYLLPINSLTLASRDLPRIALFGVAAVFIASVSAAQKRTAEIIPPRTGSVAGRGRGSQDAQRSTAARERSRTQGGRTETLQAEGELQATIDMILAMVARYRHDGSYDFVNADLAGLYRPFP